jgi:hypothetical protein
MPSADLTQLGPSSLDTSALLSVVIIGTVVMVSLLLTKTRKMHVPPTPPINSGLISGSPVDLAGFERANSTGLTSQRLKEGVNIFIRFTIYHLGVI